MRVVFALFVWYLTINVRLLVKKKASSTRSVPKRGAAQKPESTRLAEALPRRPIFGSIFGIDPRSLAAFRIAAGALLLVDLAVRASDLNAMYTDNGMFSRAEVFRHVPTVWNWSFHFGSGSWGYQAMLFAIAGTLAAALLIGFETRLATIGSWLMLLSLHHRVPPINSGADVLLRMLLFWGMFLPLGRVWSVDRWLSNRHVGAAKREDEIPVLSVASAAILLQMALMYFFSGIFKSNPAWFSGQAVAGIFGDDFYAAPLSAYALKFPLTLRLATWGTLALEYVAPVLMLCPWWTARLRLGCIAALGSMHVAIGILLNVGPFSFVSLAGLTLFLPAEFWNTRLLARISRRTEIPEKFSASPERSVVGRTPLDYVTGGVCGLLLISLVIVNINSLPSHPLASEAPVKGSFLRTACGFAQKWSMFEGIPTNDGWYVAWAKLRDGSKSICYGMVRLSVGRSLIFLRGCTEMSGGERSFGRCPTRTNWATSIFVSPLLSSFVVTGTPGTPLRNRSASLPSSTALRQKARLQTSPRSKSARASGSSIWIGANPKANE
jgi:hypothetical protein